MFHKHPSCEVRQLRGTTKNSLRSSRGTPEKRLNQFEFFNNL